MKKLTFTVLIEPEEEGGFSVYCPALAGCVSQGETYEETLENIREAIVGYVKSLVDDGFPIPQELAQERIEVVL